MKRITVFTPTYNRAYAIGNVYESLKKQTFKNFEWLVIDDGSTDGTDELFKKWINEDNFFEIRYYQVENGGRARALNKGFDLADGELFAQINSYEHFTDDALEKIDRFEKSIAGKKGFAGISGCRGYSETEIIGSMPVMTKGYIDATSLERKHYKIKGDKAEVFYTSVLRKYKFPEFEGENYVPPSIVWYAIANDGYKIRWFNDIIRVGGYLKDGITKNKATALTNSPKGYLEYTRRILQFKRYNFGRRLLLLGVFSIRTVYDDNFAAKQLGVPLFFYKTIKILALLYDKASGKNLRIKHIEDKNEK